MHRIAKNKILLLSNVVTILFLNTASGCGGDQSNIIRVGGSTTVQPLAELWSTAFEAINPEINVTVEGGGSSSGVRGCGDDIYDIGTVSRELTSGETSNWPELKVFHVAFDGIAIVVHPSNTTLTNLSIEELEDIYSTGSDNTWTVICREYGSGTRNVFDETIMKHKVTSTNTEFLGSNGAIKQKVASTKNAIGYISEGFVDSSVKVLTLNGIACNETNCRNGSYPLNRYLNFVTRGNPSKLEQDFIDFCRSEQGQQISEDEGYYKLDHLSSSPLNN